MRCHEMGYPFGRKWIRRPVLRRTAKSILAAPVVLGLASCGGHIGNFDAPEIGGSKLANLLGFKSNDAPAAPGAEVRHIFCPQVVVLEGTAASQAYSGTPPSSANLRHQNFPLGNAHQTFLFDH